MKDVYCLWIVCLSSIYRAQAIISGIPSAIDNHPFQVALLSNDKFIGGGVIIFRDIVISDSNAYNQLLLQYTWPTTSVALSIRAGSSNNNEGGELINVRKTVVIKQMEDDFTDTVLSIMFLEKNLTYSDTVQNIELADRLPELPSNCSISGWGYTKNDFLNLPIQLQAGRSSLVNNSNCNVTESSSTLCLTGSDACTGDSGGPLVCEKLLVGIASDLQHCGVSTFTGSYLSIPLLFDRIMDVVNQMKNEL